MKKTFWSASITNKCVLLTASVRLGILSWILEGRKEKKSSQRFIKILLAKISADAADDGPSKDRK